VNYLKSVRRLGSIVVIHLGTNSTTTEEVLDQIMATLADTPLVLFLTVYVPSEPRQTINNRLINALPTKYANVKVLDWHSIAGQYPEYLLGSNPLATSWCTLLRRPHHAVDRATVTEDPSNRSPLVLCLL